MNHFNCGFSKDNIIKDKILLLFYNNGCMIVEIFMYSMNFST